MRGSGKDRSWAGSVDESAMCTLQPFWRREIC